jgi:hypothetical protein
LPDTAILPSFEPTQRTGVRRNSASSTGESRADPIFWIMVDAGAKKLAGAMPITGFGRVLRKH